jgi:probable rRNA maturation factor
MKRLPVNFFSEDLTYNLKHKTKVRNWIRQTIEDEGQKLKELNFIFCSDAYLLEINEKFLRHSNYTDIITFDNSTENGLIEADIFISIERVSENAVKYHVSKTDELHRVLIHGVLHLCGFRDKSKANKVLMTSKENKYLSLRKF